MVRVSLEVLQLKKSEFRVDQVEDAYQPRRRGVYSGDTLAFALSDGAGSSSFPSIWASILVRFYVKRKLVGPNDLRLASSGLAHLWKTKLRNRELNWCSSAKMEMGSFATLLGLTVQRLSNVRKLRWHGIALGDTVLFKIRDSKLILQFPYCSSTDFDKNPILLSTRAEKNKSVWPEVHTICTSCKQGDVFLLMTDALAQWFVRNHENKRRPWRTLLLFAEKDKNKQKEFREWVESLRARRKIRDDDTTLMIVKVLKDDKAARSG